MRRGDWKQWVAAGVALVALGAHAATRSWTLVDLGTLGGPGSYATAISNSGYVVGCADVPGSGAHAFLYDGNSMRDLEPGAAPGTNGCALAVNDAGVAAGRSSTDQLVVWSSGAMKPIGAQGTIGAIDGGGTIVGGYREGGVMRAFVYAGGQLTTLALPDGPSTATDINGRGQIVGTVNARAFLYENGSMRDLGTLGGSTSNARSINDGGAIVGIASDANAQPQAFEFDGAMRALPGPGYSGAVAINNAGQVVGNAEGTYGFLVEGGSVTRLDTLPAVVAKGWRHLEATGINDRGWIVGTATNAAGDLRAFVLKPGSDRAPVAALARVGRGPQ